MQCFVLATFISFVLLESSTCLFIDDAHQQVKLYTPHSDPGEPLFLTEYIESGDIQNVSAALSTCLQCVGTSFLIDLTLYISISNILLIMFIIFQARKLALVNHSDIDILSYAGYFTVNKTCRSNLFFWYFPAAENVDNAPVLLWLQGLL